LRIDHLFTWIKYIYKLYIFWYYLYGFSLTGFLSCPIRMNCDFCDISGFILLQQTAIFKGDVLYFHYICEHIIINMYRHPIVISNILADESMDVICRISTAVNHIFRKSNLTKPISLYEIGITFCTFTTR